MWIFSLQSHYFVQWSLDGLFSMTKLLERLTKHVTSCLQALGSVRNLSICGNILYHLKLILKFGLKWLGKICLHKCCSVTTVWYLPNLLHGRRIMLTPLLFLQAKQVKLRAPISESLSRLDRSQLQKFAQYLIHELQDKQILPHAQRLLDELLSTLPSTINKLDGAPG